MSLQEVLRFKRSVASMVKQKKYKFVRLCYFIFNVDRILEYQHVIIIFQYKIVLEIKWYILKTTNQKVKKQKKDDQFMNKLLLYTLLLQAKLTQQAENVLQFTLIDQIMAYTQDSPRKKKKRSQITQILRHFLQEEKTKEILKRNFQMVELEHMTQ